MRYYCLTTVPYWIVDHGMNRVERRIKNLEKIWEVERSPFPDEMVLKRVRRMDEEQMSTDWRGIEERSVKRRGNVSLQRGTKLSHAVSSSGDRMTNHLLVFSCFVHLKKTTTQWPHQERPGQFQWLYINHPCRLLPLAERDERLCIGDRETLPFRVSSLREKREGWNRTKLAHSGFHRINNRVTCDSILMEKPLPFLECPLIFITPSRSSFFSLYVLPLSP